MRICPDPRSPQGPSDTGRPGPDVNNSRVTLHSHLNITFAFYQHSDTGTMTIALQRKKNVQYRMMNFIDSEYNKYLCIQMHTFNALYTRPWMINELYRSLKGSLIYCLPSSGNSAQKLLFFTPWMWSDLAEVRRLRRTNFLEIAIICEFGLSVANMCDMSHGEQGPTDEPQLSVLFTVLDFTPRQ